MIRQELADRFWKNVRRAEGDGCWEWTLSTTRAGYGQVRYKGRNYYAHHLGYRLQFGPIPDGMFVPHRCDNPRCVRHLFAGTQHENVLDMHAKGRNVQVKGSEVGRAKLTEAQVSNARDEYARGGITYRQLGEKYGVSHTAMRHAVTGINWRHV